jgi:hypothetical protein
MNYQAVLVHVMVLLLGWSLGFCLVVAALYLASRYLVWWRHKRVDRILLELTPPMQSPHELPAADQFYNALCQGLRLQSWRDIFGGNRPSLSLEIVSTREKGIRYMVRLPRADKTLFLRNLAAYAPDVTALETRDYVPEYISPTTTRLLEFRQTGHRRYPLRYSTGSKDYDPTAFLTNALGGVAADETVALQIVLTPVRYWNPLRGIMQTPSSVRAADALRADLRTATQQKAGQLGIYANVRAFVQTSSASRNDERVRAIRSAFATYAYEGYQALVPRLERPSRLVRYRLAAYKLRLPSLIARYFCLLSTSEIALLFHFPFGVGSRTEDLALNRHRTLAVPLNMKHQPRLDVTFGKNVYRGQETPIGLTAAERQRHVYMVGGTGNGKTTMLEYAIRQDIEAGKGIAVLDPHGDLAESLLRSVPTKRMDDVVYFNPSDLRYPIGLNLLELPRGLEGDELLHAKDMVTESVVSLFRKLFSAEGTSGHRIEYVLRNTIQTALTMEQPTLFTVYRLLNDANFRKPITDALDNPDLRLFWKNEFGKSGGFQQVSMAAGITAKIGRFLFSASARRIIEQPESTIDFDDLLQSRKILICNLSKGNLGEDTSELLGSTVLAKLQLATLRRASMTVGRRRPFYLYVDEFQNFATQSFVEMLSEARKYRLFVTMAEQSTAQQKDSQTVDIILANVGTVICFRTGSPLDELRLLPLFGPLVEPGTINNLPAYTFYARIAAVQPKEPFSGQTIVELPAYDSLHAQLIIQSSRNQYGRQAADEPLRPRRQAVKTVAHSGHFRLGDIH